MNFLSKLVCRNARWVVYTVHLQKRYFCTPITERLKREEKLNVLLQQGKHFVSVGKHEEGRKKFLEALNVDSNSKIALVSLADTFLLTNQPQNAIPYYEKCATLPNDYDFPENERINFNAAIACQLAGSLDKALSYYSKFYDNWLNNLKTGIDRYCSEAKSKAMCSAAGIHIIKGEYKKAEDLLQTVKMHYNGPSFRADYGLGVLYRHTGDFVNSNKFFTEFTNFYNSENEAKKLIPLNLYQRVLSMVVDNNNELKSAQGTENENKRKENERKDEFSQFLRPNLPTKDATIFNEVNQYETFGKDTFPDSIEESEYMNSKEVGDIVYKNEELVTLEMVKICVDINAPEAGIVTYINPTPNDKEIICAMVPFRLSLHPEKETDQRTQTPEKEIGPEEVAKLVRDAKKIVALTGSGISVSSGLKTRKDLWSTMKREEYVSIWGFEENPSKIWELIEGFYDPVQGSPAPNEAHKALFELERMGKLTGIITQNVDNLHQDAGNTNVIELHGSLLRSKCMKCGADNGHTYSLVKGLADIPPKCTKNVGNGCTPEAPGLVRPDVVMFGEWVDVEKLKKAIELCKNCDLLLIVGTAMDVSPAAELPRTAKIYGAKVVEFKRKPSRITNSVTDYFVPGQAAENLPAAMAHL